RLGARLRMTRATRPVLTVLIAVLLAAAAAAQEPRATVRDVAAVTGTVERVDVFSRSLTVRTADNLTHVLYVGPELDVLRELHKGDAVLVRISESVIVALKPGAKPTSVVDTTNAAKKAPEAGRSDVLQQLKAVVTIEHVDLPMHIVVYKGAD